MKTCGSYQISMSGWGSMSLVSRPRNTLHVHMFCAIFALHSRACLSHFSGIRCMTSPQLRRSVNAGSAALDGQFQVVEFKKRSDGSWELQTSR